MKNLKFTSLAMLAIIAVALTSCFEKVEKEENDISPAVGIAGKWEMKTITYVAGTTETTWTLDEFLQKQVDDGEPKGCSKFVEFVPDQELVISTNIKIDGTTETASEKCVVSSDNMSFQTFPDNKIYDWTVLELTQSRLVFKSPTSYDGNKPEPKYERYVLERVN